MKRIDNLYEKIIDMKNLERADRKARRGKLQSYGVRLHDQNRKTNLEALYDALLTKTYKTSEYEVFTIYDPKERQISRLPYYPDRIVHHAIMNILEPIWSKTFTYNTYSCIKKRGIEGCARRFKEFIREFDGKPLYCLKIDIRKYYPSISHRVLKCLVRRKIKDENLLWLIDEIIDSAPGLPIGNYLSQYLANLCLCYFMHWVNEKLPYILQKELGLESKPVIRSTEYADDIAFLNDSKEVLRCAFKHIRRYIEEELELQIKGNWQIFPVAENRYDRHGRAVDYVGYKFYRKQQLIRKNIKKNFCRKAAELNRLVPAPEAASYKQTLAPWLGWAKHSNSRHLLKTIIKPNYYESIL